MSEDANGDRVAGCEDCLYLNIYVPARNLKETLLPVMFFIHGGAFQFGSGNEVDESFLMDRDVVLVTFNYRVGPFGFLSTGSRLVPGNMGLKDQSMALKWVSNYIKNFGGNPKNITLFGMSAGAASVHYHYLSPLSAGLFHRGISISGVALDPWSQTERAPEKAMQLGALLGCSTKTLSKMIHCLQERPARQIAQAVGDFMYWLYNPYVPFGPVVEKQLLPRPFLHKSPMEIISKGNAMDVPWITGVVSEEGLYAAAEFVANDTRLKQLNDEWDEIVPYLLDFNDTIPLSKHTQVSQKIRKYYLGDKKVNDQTVKPVIEMIGDRMLAVNYEKAVRLQAHVNKSPVWTYYYTYRSQHSLSEALSGSTKNFGVSHGDDIYLILNPAQSNTDRPQDKQMQELLLDFYTSFAINGKPSIGTATWETIDSSKIQFRYLHIADPQHISMDGDNNFASKAFWNTIPFEENSLS
ncbi:venom carboxylesterase-6 [Calliopsis andreniformis]|uniref:venom carboxylesterase-6 n=1 Tax=Calliopsis andreniformis TaxID=337506 RepID=UPI003FCDE128